MTPFKTALASGQLIKAIAGIAQSDLNVIDAVVAAANQAGVGAIDVKADAAIVAHVRPQTTALLFASGITAQALAEAVAAGADVAEVGNFDALYAQGIYLTAQDVITLVQETQALLPEGTPLSVTIPGHLSAEAQVRLALQLEAMGVDLLQSEGAARVVSTQRTVELLSAEEKAQATFENARRLAASVRIPVMVASGLTAENIGQAAQTGSMAYGVGSAINQLTSADEMAAILGAMQAVLASTATRAALAS